MVPFRRVEYRFHAIECVAVGKLLGVHVHRKCGFMICARSKIVSLLIGDLRVVYIVDISRFQRYILVSRASPSVPSYGD